VQFETGTSRPKSGVNSIIEGEKPANSCQSVIESQRLVNLRKLSFATKLIDRLISIQHKLTLPKYLSLSAKLWLKGFYM
jgi:hypothetical protein